MTLYGIDAPDMFGKEKEAGIKSRDWLAGKIKDKFIMIKVDDKEPKDDDGRLVVIVMVGPKEKAMRDIRT